MLASINIRSFSLSSPLFISFLAISIVALTLSVILIRFYYTKKTFAKIESNKCLRIIRALDADALETDEEHKAIFESDVVSSLKLSFNNQDDANKLDKESWKKIIQDIKKESKQILKKFSLEYLTSENKHQGFITSIDEKLIQSFSFNENPIYKDKLDVNISSSLAPHTPHVIKRIYFALEDEFKKKNPETTETKKEIVDLITFRDKVAMLFTEYICNIILQRVDAKYSYPATFISEPEGLLSNNASSRIHQKG